VAGFVVLAALTWLAGRFAAFRIGRSTFDIEAAGQDIYYVSAHLHVLAAVGALFLVFGAIYLALERAGRGRRRHVLGAIHFAATFVGAAVIFVPQHVVVLVPRASPRPEDFFWLNAVAGAGYVVILAGQVFFVAVLIDALRPRRDLR
jgi:heme/copper-type cytochrome/quinol oxidase subunit 1